MKTNTKLLILGILVFACLNIYLVFEVRKLRKAELPADNSAYELLNENYNSLFDKEFLECIDQNTPVRDTLGILNTKGEKVTLSSLLPVKGKFKLVVRISQESCFTCFTHTFKIMDTFINTLDQSQLLYLGFFDNITTMTTFMESNFTKVTPFDLQKKLSLRVESLNLPYMFVIDENGTAHNVFVISKQNQHQVEGYLKAMSKKYF